MLKLKARVRLELDFTMEPPEQHKIKSNHDSLEEPRRHEGTYPSSDPHEEAQ